MIEFIPQYILLDANLASNELLNKSGVITSKANYVCYKIITNDLGGCTTYNKKTDLLYNSEEELIQAINESKLLKIL